MFFALKGDNFNGNKFASDAIKNGAKYAIIDEIEYKEDNNFITIKLNNENKKRTREGTKNEGLRKTWEK